MTWKSLRHHEKMLDIIMTFGNLRQEVRPDFGPAEPSKSAGITGRHTHSHSHTLSHTDRHRHTMNKRRKEDPEFAEKLRENCRVCNKKNPRTNDEKMKQYNAEYYLNKKNKLIELEELKKSLNIGKI